VRILNELLAAYLERNLDAALDSANATATWLGDQVVKLKSELEQRELELHEYKREKQILSVSLVEQSNMLRAEMSQLNERLTTVRTQIQAYQARNSELQRIVVDNPASVPASELLQNDTLQQMRSRYLAALGEKGRLTAIGKGAEHPTVRAADAELSMAKEALLLEVRNLQEAVARDLKIAKLEADGLSGLFKQAEQRGMDLGLLEIEYRRLERDKANTERLYTIVMERNKDGDVTKLMRFNNLRVVDKPTNPRSPVRPNLSTNLALGGGLGLLLGLGMVFARDALDRSIRSPEHLEALGVAFLGLLPASGTVPLDGPDRPKKRRRRERQTAPPEPQLPAELTVHASPRSGLAEASRSVRTNIRFMSPDKPYKTLLVTSAAPSEGKTTVACCLAIAMAQAGDRVLLIDCDLRRPRLHRVFGRGNDDGVTTMLLDPKEFDPKQLGTSIPNLSVLTSGPHAPNPAELVNSERFTTVFKSLAEHYDRIIVDSPPIAPVTDAAILSTRVDATILVVRASVTSRDLARRALRTLRDVGAPLAGAVLNAVAVEGRRGYYYYYQYSYGYGDAETPATQS
jgi:polysaccharide biosynthesis transport protein